MVYDVAALLASGAGAGEAKTLEGSGPDSKDIRGCLAQATNQADHPVVVAPWLYAVPG